MKSAQRNWLLYSVDTYFAVSDDESVSGSAIYMAVTSQPITHVKTGDHWYPMNIGTSRDEAVSNLKQSVTRCSGFPDESQAHIAVHHHQEYTCMMCPSKPVFRDFEEFRNHWENYEHRLFI